MTFHNESIQKKISSMWADCLIREDCGQLTKDELKYKKTAYAIKYLKRMRRTEIIVKIVAFSWAVIWSAACTICFLAEGIGFKALLAALPAAGFWIILTRSAGSVAVINMEIKELKKEIKE